MQRSQKYERETALAEIENGRKTLLDKLREYKGKDLEVIQEAIILASETVEEGSDLLLPAYLTRPPITLKKNGFPSNSNLILKTLENGAYDLIKKNQSGKRKGPVGGCRHVIASLAKTAIALVGVASTLSFAGLGTKENRTNFSPFGALKS